MTNGERIQRLLADIPGAYRLFNAQRPPSPDDVRATTVGDCMAFLGALTLGQGPQLGTVTAAFGLLFTVAHPEVDTLEEDGTPTTNVFKATQLLEGYPTSQAWVGNPTQLDEIIRPELPTPELLTLVGTLDLLGFPHMDDVRAAANAELGRRGYGGDNTMELTT